MTLARLAVLIRVKAIVAKLDTVQLPACLDEFRDLLAPLILRERLTRSDGLAQFDAVRQSLRLSPFAHHYFTHSKSGDETELVRGRV